MAIQKTTNIIIAGVGGQGNRTLMHVIAHAALAAEEEVHTLSSTSLGRLGGPITCHMRIGPAASAAIPMGEADILIALEMNEALRALPMLHRGALAFIYTYRRLPIMAGIHGMQYPSVDTIANMATGKDITSIFVPASLSAPEHHNAEQGQYTANITILGALCGHTGLLPRFLVEQALCECLPEYKEPNFQALAIGWHYGEKLRG